MEQPGAEPVTSVVLSPELEQLVTRCEAKELPCPWCGVPLDAYLIELGEEIAVQLTCPDRTCGFEEI